MGVSRSLIIILLATVALLSLGGCGISRSDESPTPSASAPGDASPTASPLPSPTSGAPSPSPTASPQRATVSVYLLRGAFVATAHRAIAATNAPAGAALEELLMGPTSEERAAGLHTQIPAGTKVLGLTIRDGLAVVDLSPEFVAGVDPIEDRARLAQIVYTLTQFPTVDGVRFRVAGEPLVFRSGEGEPQRQPQTRRSFEDVTPAIFVERPAVGDRVASPLVVQGTANTFEAQFMIRVRDASGTTLVEESVMATSGSGTRGTFNATMRFIAPSSSIVLELFEPSAASGLPTHVVKIPLPLTAASPSP